MRMTHGRAVLTMVGATLLWSIAGVVTRFLDGTRGFELTFWRSLFSLLALVLLLCWLRGPGPLWRSLRTGGWVLWASAFFWAVMFTAFMMALSLTAVANVLVTEALAPLLTALLAWVLLKHRLAARTWLAVALAGAGIAWMYAGELAVAEPRHLLGTLVALAVPLAAAANWTLLQHVSRLHPSEATDMLPPVLLGSLLSAAVALPLAWPLSATPHDLSLLALLGVLQLAVPCLMAVAAARVLSAPETSLLGLLEVVFGVAWAWLGANEPPSTAVLGGGALVLGALVLNEALALRQRGAAAASASPNPSMKPNHERA